MEKEILYTPGRLGKLEMKNRWIMLAMHTGYAEEDGSFSRRDLEFYRARAGGGAAAITLVGGVNEIGCQERMHRLDNDRYNSGIEEVCHVIHQGGAKVLMQLFHAGRNNTAQCHNGKAPLCPSPVPSPIYKAVPREMTEEEIRQTIKDFASAAVRCRQNGVDGVEVSISVGYLLSQFLSPLVNHRTDEWGGTAEKRMAFPTAVLEEIRQAVGPDYTVIIKISGGDMLGGYDVKYMVDFINRLPKGTIDGVTVTGGWHEAPVPQMTYHVKPGGFAYLAGAVKQGTGMPVIACNRINSPDAAEEILQKGLADFAGAARPFLADPYFAEKARQGQLYNKCQGCNRGCIERVLKYKDVRCAFNPETGREYLGSAPKKYENVLVVGAGPTGLQAAHSLAKAGSHVTVITDQKDVGGKLELTAIPPYKQDMEIFKRVLLQKVKEDGCEILTETPVNAGLLEALHPDYVLFATGGEPIRLKVKGLDESKMKREQAEDVLRGVLPERGSRIVIVGGGVVGLETAEHLGEKENEYHITVIEMAPKAGKDLGGLRWIMMKELKKLGVQVKTSSRLEEVEDDKVIVVESGKTEKGEPLEEKRVYSCDFLIFAVGSRPRGAAGMEEWLEQAGIPYGVIGDGKMPSNIMEGMIQAYEATRW